MLDIFSDFGILACRDGNLWNGGFFAPSIDNQKTSCGQKPTVVNTALEIPVSGLATPLWAFVVCGKKGDYGIPGVFEVENYTPAIPRR